MNMKLKDMGTAGLHNWVFDASSRRERRLRKGRAAKIIRNRYNTEAADKFNQLCDVTPDKVTKY